MKNRIKLGLIGCGKQAAKHLAAIQKMGGVDVILSDIQPEYAKSLADKTGSAWVKHPDMLFETEDVCATVICTPTPTHGEFILKSLERDKHVFCEKPLCEGMEEASTLKEAESRSKGRVVVGYIYRHVPVFEEGHRLFSESREDDQGTVTGKPLSAFFRIGGRGSHQLWKHRKDKGGGAVNEMLVHMIDLANWYFGPLSNVNVIGKYLKCPTRSIQNKTESVDAEDLVMIHCTGRDGVDVFCQADLITPAFVQYTEIQSENGTFMGSIQPDMPSFLFLKEGRAGYETGKTPLTFGKHNILDIQMSAFIQMLLNGGAPDRNRIEDSVELLKTIDIIKHHGS